MPRAATPVEVAGELVRGRGGRGEAGARLILSDDADMGNQGHQVVARGALAASVGRQLAEDQSGRQAEALIAVQMEGVAPPGRGVVGGPAVAENGAGVAQCFLAVD